ncbi:alpha/beta fold hydrolase [Tenggerimyces flavus]|uniref:Alpha/beta fold hydrolase n=1 Tax=Tenggerimyces flavus TaxID=1708749 RepID=A0ABV7YNP7_9ACTN|nr:alpha/beta hydrolase [Tenggerimyces flavus]MBM7790406.1 pimeloyl-ACP methyl ester carboxylesterase [Tenggerimyces flavus]
MTHTRRHLLRTASVAGTAGLALSLASPASAAGKRRGLPTFVFVTGASGTASGDPELTMRGYRTVGVELPGHGPSAGQFDAAYQAPQDLEALAVRSSPMATVTLDDFEAATVAVIRRVARLGPVIVVGSSMGGATLNRVGNAVPHLIDHLVYDAAFCPSKLPTVVDCLAAPEGATSKGDALIQAAVGDPAVIGATRINWRLGGTKFLAEAKEALAGDSTDGEFLAFLNASQPDESVEVPLADCAIDPARWGRIPRTYVRHTLDQLIPLALQTRMIRDADALTRRSRFTVHDVATAHLASPARWAEIVDLLDTIARRL